MRFGPTAEPIRHIQVVKHRKHLIGPGERVPLYLADTLPFRPPLRRYLNPCYSGDESRSFPPRTLLDLFNQPYLVPAVSSAMAVPDSLLLIDVQNAGVLVAAYRAPRTPVADRVQSERREQIGECY